MGAETLIHRPLKEISKQLDNSRMLTTKQYREIDCQVFKETADQLVGFSLAKKNNGEMIIIRIAEDGLIAKQTQLSVGDIVLAINQVGCTAFTANDIKYEGLGPKEAVELMKSGTVISIRAMKPVYSRHSTVLAAEKPHLRLIEAIITKENDQQSLGFSLDKNNQGALTVKKTLPGGLVTRQHSGLRPGYIILSINGKDASAMTVKEVGQVLKSELTVTIRAQKRHFEKDKIVKTSVHKIPVTTPLGMTLSKCMNGAIEIKAIKHDSLVYHTGLQSGMTLLSINDMDCQGKTVKQVNEFIAKLPAGEVTLRCQSN